MPWHSKRRHLIQEHCQLTHFPCLHWGGTASHVCRQRAERAGAQSFASLQHSVSLLQRTLGGPLRVRREGSMFGLLFEFCFMEILKQDFY